MRTFYIMCTTLVILQMFEVLDGFTTGVSARATEIDNDLVNQDSDGQQQNVATQEFPIIEKYDFESIFNAMSYIFQNIKNEIIKQIAILLKRLTDMVKMSSLLMGSAVQQIGKQFRNVQETAGKGFEIISGVENGETNGMNNIKEISESMIQTPVKLLSNVSGTLPFVGKQFSKSEANTRMADNKVNVNKNVEKRELTSKKKQEIEEVQKENQNRQRKKKTEKQ